MDPYASARRRLVETIADYGSTLVAFSGGVDSALVAKAAHAALGDRAVAVVSDSPTLPRSELEAARRLAMDLGMRFHAMPRSELDDPGFVANPVNRCAFCKHGLVKDLAALARDWGMATVSLGVNQTDLGDWRPGIEAARGAGARFPLLEAGLGKPAIRALARRWGLSVWDKPAAPCLSSRIPYGQAVTHEALARIEAAEEFLKLHGFRDVRVRHMGPGARVEVPADDVTRLKSLAATVTAALSGLGFSRVELDSRGLTSGRLNVEHAGPGPRPVQ